MGRKHKTDDVSDLGATRSLVSGDMSGSRLPKSMATKYYLFPQSIIVIFEKQGKSDYSKEMVFLQPFLTFVIPQT